jgi:quinol monooxygenase YgiN
LISSLIEGAVTLPLYQTASFKIRPEAREHCERGISEFIDSIKANEPGTLRYLSLPRQDDPTSYLHFFIFQDEEARDRHAHSAAVQRFTSILYPETLAEVEFPEYTLVASTSV